ncbi:hypothetical protein CFP71_25095 [Amycolatopsis thailandensis]|uniref:Uncharacterized protein n=1 Tax=Amycolatopsis thailandensis TaxID=589330 RepID=A0A229RY44_9PSEU|nr:hypothetical protein [Amycolatopsis thailandensis]OXM51593.1 hypothetical protein CFP71_25095 [Amycolatopsis thailandensis]
MQQTLVPEAGVETTEPSRRPQVLTAVAGFVIGGGVIGMLWALSGVNAGALEDAQDACQALARVGTIPDTTDSPGDRTVAVLAPEVLHRMTAARELSAAAAAANDTYRPLAEHIDGVSRMVFSLHFNDISGQRHVAQAEQLCTQL